MVIVLKWGHIDLNSKCIILHEMIVKVLGLEWVVNQEILIYSIVYVREKINRNHLNLWVETWIIHKKTWEIETYLHHRIRIRWYQNNLREKDKIKKLLDLNSHPKFITAFALWQGNAFHIIVIAFYHLFPVLQNVVPIVLI